MYTNYGSQSKFKQAIIECNLRKIICAILVLCSYFCFLYFSIDAFLEYAEGKIGVNQISTPVSKLPLPTITVCSKEGYKNINAENTPDDVLRNLSNHVFTMNDFFHPTFLENLHEWNVHEIFNMRLGVCFSLKSIYYLQRNNKVVVGAYKNTHLRLQKEKKYQNTSKNTNLRLLKGNKYQVKLLNQIISMEKL